MGRRVKEDGGSQCRLVMRQIGVEPSGKVTLRESVLTSIRCLVTREFDEPMQEAKQMTAVFTLAGAASRRKANRQQMSIVKVVLRNTTGLGKKPLRCLSGMRRKMPVPF